MSSQELGGDMTTTTTTTMQIRPWQIVAIGLLGALAQAAVYFSIWRALS